MSKKNTKRALLSSVLCLVLCLAMLTGTTFAWFTDSVTSGVNKIVAGNLDVELYHTNSYITDEKVDGLTDLFTVAEGETVLWEPGMVVWENFTVANEGDLALKYQLFINFTNEVIVNGHGLSEVLKVAVVEDGFNGDREAAKNLTFNDTLESFMLHGELEGNTTSKTYGVVIYWEPTDHDNDYNMNNENKGKTLAIDLGIVLNATQEMFEEDSFNDQYDAGAYLPVVNTADELASALADGKSVKMGEDIAVTETIEIPENATVVLDMNGKTLEATNGNIALRTYGDLVLAGEGTVKGNVNAYAVRVQGGSTVTIDEGIVVDGGFGAISVPGGTLIVNGGDFSNEEVNASHYVVSVWNNGKIIINGGTFTFGEDRYAGNNGAPVIGAWGGGSVEIRGGTFDAFPGSALCYAGVPVVIKGGTFKNAAANTYGGSVSSLVADGYVANTNADGSVTVSLPQAGLNTIISNAQNGATVSLPAGNYTLPNLSGKDLTITGNEDAVVNLTSFPGSSGTTVVIEGVTVNWADNATYNGFQSAAGVTYRNCTINGGSYLYCDTVFENCTFTGDYYITTYSAQNVTFVNCDFNKTDSRSILIYNDGSSYDINVTVTDCRFNATQKGYNWNKTQWIGAIDIDNSLMSGTVTVNVSGCTVTDSYNGLVRHKNGSAATLVINAD